MIKQIVPAHFIWAVLCGLVLTDCWSDLHQICEIIFARTRTIKDANLTNHTKSKNEFLMTDR